MGSSDGGAMHIYMYMDKYGKSTWIYKQVFLYLQTW